MTYLITQIVFSLVLAGVLGGVIGWLINGYRAYSRQQQSHSELMRHSLLLSQAETDNKMIEEDFRELKHRSEETIMLLKEESRQIPELKKNLEKSQTLVRQLLQKHDAEIRQVTSENSSLNNKVRELENREKAVTRLQMDLNTERLKMRSDSSSKSAAEDDAPVSAPSANDNSIRFDSRTALDTDSDHPASHNQGVHHGLTEQTEIPLSSEVVTKPGIETSTLHSNTDNSFDDILKKADNVLTRFRDDPSVELDAFQMELDKELDAIRHDLSAEPDLLADLPESTGRAQENRSSTNKSSAALGDDTKQFDEANTGSVPVLHKSADTQTSESNQHPSDAQLSDTAELQAESSVSTSIPFHQVFGPEFTPPTHHDDLQHIFGIGPVTERTLNSIAISSYEQLALFEREHIEYVAEVLQIFPGRIEKDDWVGSASEIVADRQSRHGGPSAHPEKPQDAPESAYINRLEDA